ncbi:MAG: VanZ family protein [Candidatus Latescibacterota bacterium]
MEQNRFKLFFIFQGPAILYAIVIYIMSSFPGYTIPTIPFDYGDKVVHMLEFGLFGIFLYRAFRFPKPSFKPLRQTIAFGILYAASDEIHQLFVPKRFCDFYDFAADCIGLILFAYISSRLNPAPNDDSDIFILNNDR